MRSKPESDEDALIQDMDFLELEKQLESAKNALIDIAKVSFAGPNTDERREWIWARATKCLDQNWGLGVQAGSQDE